jgi:hypothetical protein
VPGGTGGPAPPVGRVRAGDLRREDDGARRWDRDPLVRRRRSRCRGRRKPPPSGAGECTPLGLHDGIPVLRGSPLSEGTVR